MNRFVSRAHRCIALACLPALLCGAAAAQSLQDARQQISTAWESHKSMTCKVVVEADPAVGQNRVGMRGEGKVQALRGDGLERYKALLKLSFAPPMGATMQVENVFDGATLYLGAEALGKKEMREATPELYRGAVPPGGAPLLDALAQGMELSLLPDAKVGDSDVWVVEGIASTASGVVPPVARSRAYIAKDSGALLKLELYETPQVISARFTYSEFAWDEEMDAAIFAPSEEDSEAPAEEEPAVQAAGGTAP